MTKILGHTGSAVYIGHFQGSAMKKHLDLVEEYSRKEIMISPRVSVITNFTDKPQAITALQLEFSNMPYVNASQEGIKQWSNVDKIKNYVEALEKTTTEYSLLVDGYDVLFFRDIDEEFLSEFEKMGKKILFNASKNKHPNFDIDFANDREGLGEFKNLNAGVAFGKTDDLLEFYKEALELTKRKDIMNPWESEQLYIRLAADGKEEVGFDSECILFQTFSKAQQTICGSTVIIY